MNNELHSLILSNARYKVAKENGYADWIHLCISCEKIVISEFSKQAALIAMEELAGFLRWTHFNNWRPHPKLNKCFCQGIGISLEIIKETYLYTQYLNEKKDADK